MHQINKTEKKCARRPKHVLRRLGKTVWNMTDSVRHRCQADYCPVSANQKGNIAYSAIRNPWIHGHGCLVSGK